MTDNSINIGNIFPNIIINHIYYNCNCQNKRIAP